VCCRYARVQHVAHACTGCWTSSCVRGSDTRLIEPGSIARATNTCRSSLSISSPAINIVHLQSYACTCVESSLRPLAAAVQLLSDPDFHGHGSISADRPPAPNAFHHLNLRYDWAPLRAGFVQIWRQRQALYMWPPVPVDAIASQTPSTCSPSYERCVGCPAHATILAPPRASPSGHAECARLGQRNDSTGSGTAN
jgi:hypothetical protein